MPTKSAYHNDMPTSAPIVSIFQVVMLGTYAQRIDFGESNHDSNSSRGNAVKIGIS